MWDMSKGLVQVEVGANVIKKFTERDTRGVFEVIFGSSAPSEGGLFCTEAERLRQELSGQNVYLPPVRFSDSDDLSPNQFVVYVGVKNSPGDITQYDLFETLKSMIIANQIDDPSPQSVRELFMEGVQYFSDQDFNRAINVFSVVYYWATILGCADELINATINIGTIMLFNNHIDDALMYAQCANLLAENPAFYNVNLKFYSHHFLANMYWLKDERLLATEYYRKTVEDVQFSGELPANVFARWNAANAYLWTGNYAASASLLDTIFSLVRNNEQFSKETIQQLYELRAVVSNLQVTDLLERNERLLQQIETLSTSFRVKLSDTVIQLVKKSGAALLNYFGGYLLGALSNMEINNHSKNTTYCIQ